MTDPERSAAMKGNKNASKNGLSDKQKIGLAAGVGYFGAATIAKNTLNTRDIDRTKRTLASKAETLAQDEKKYRDAWRTIKIEEIDAYNKLKTKRTQSAIKTLNELNSQVKARNTKIGKIGLAGAAIAGTGTYLYLNKKDK